MTRPFDPATATQVFGQSGEHWRLWGFRVPQPRRPDLVVVVIRHGNAWQFLAADDHPFTIQADYRSHREALAVYMDRERPRRRQRKEKP